MSERLNNVESKEELDEFSKDEYDDWDSLSNEPFNNGEDQEINRTELERQTMDKLNQNHSAKKVFQKIILGVTMATAIAGGATGILNNLEQKGEKRPIDVVEVVESADMFVDKDSDDLVWFEKITDDTGLAVEYNQQFRDENRPYDGALQGDVAHIDMTWWEGRGPMYSAIDQDADGGWDIVEKFDPYTDDLSTIDLNELESLDIDSLTMSGMEQLFD